MKVKWDQAFYYKCQLGPWQSVLKKGVQSELRSSCPLEGSTHTCLPTPTTPTQLPQLPSPMYVLGGPQRERENCIFHSMEHLGLWCWGNPPFLKHWHVSRHLTPCDNKPEEPLGTSQEDSRWKMLDRCQDQGGGGRRELTNTEHVNPSS